MGEDGVSVSECDVRTDRVSKREDKSEDITQSAAQTENKDYTKEQRKREILAHIQLSPRRREHLKIQKG